MCGRFTLTADPADLQAAFDWVNFGNIQLAPRYNIAPTQPIPVVTNSGTNLLDFFTWGLVPFWAKDPSISSRMINARCETIAEQPAFRTAFRERRCLVLADGYIEWKKVGSQKQPYLIRMQDQRPFAFAGLWERWTRGERSSSTSIDFH